MIESIDHAFRFWLSNPVDVWRRAKHRFLWLLDRKPHRSLALRSLRVTLLLVGILAILGSPRISPPAAAQGEPASAAEDKTKDELPTSEAPQPPPSTKSSQSKEKIVAPKPRERPNSARVYETEPQPITVNGRATDRLGRPVAGATVYLAVANNFGKFGTDAVLAQSTSDAKGRFTFSDAPLPVRLFPPPPELIEGKFQVFGTAQGYGFTWHGLRSYRPRPRPEPSAETDMDRSFYQDEAIECPLVFGPAAKVQGRVTDDLERPLVGAKIQLGVYDDLRRKGGYNWQFGLLETDGQATASPDLNFDRITSLPDSFRSIVTDADGRFVLDDLPQGAEFLAQVAYRPEFDALSTRLATAAVGRVGTIALGAAGEWNPVLIAPRRLEVLLRYADSRLPAANAIVHARGERRIPLGGAEAKTDSDGKAVLHLTPGKYLLTTEPPFDVDYVRSFLEYAVMSKPAEQSTELSIEPGAVVVLETLDAQTGAGVAGIGFLYETDRSRQRRELQSQSVCIDHPLTDDKGRLRAVVPAGWRQFVVRNHPDGYKPRLAETELLHFATGSTTKIPFEFDREPEPAGDTNDEPVERKLHELWRRQRKMAMKGKIRLFRCFQGHGDGEPVTGDEVRGFVNSFDPAQAKAAELLARLKERFPSLPIQFGDEADEMLVDGAKSRTMRSWGAGADTSRQQSLEVFNGEEIILYDPSNGQTTVGPPRYLHVHVATLADVCHWPFLRRGPTESTHPKPRKTFTQQDGKIIQESDGGESRLVADEATGFLYHTSWFRSADGSGRDLWQFEPTVYKGGAILPRLHLELTYADSFVQTVQCYFIESFEPAETLPPDAFAVSVPAGTLVLAYVDDSGSPKQDTAFEPLTDVVTFAELLSPHSRSIVPVLKVDEPAPALDPAAWLDRDGATKTPDFAGKLLLVDFWGISCGPCVGQLPTIQRAAAQYSATDLAIVGLHESRGTVDEVAAFARKHGLTFPLAIDRPAEEQGWFGAISKAFGVRGIPQSALIGRDGKLVYIGQFEQALSRADALLQITGE